MILQKQCFLLFAVATFCTAASINKAAGEDTAGHKPLASRTWLTDTIQQTVDTATKVDTHVSSDDQTIEDIAEKLSISNGDTAGKPVSLTSTDYQQLEKEAVRENLDIAALVAKGIQFNYLESDLIQNGLVKCYDQPYSSPTTSSNLAACSQSDYVFVGAKSCLDATIVAVGAFGSSSSIFAATASTTTAIFDAVGSVFWYRVPGASFGFASSSSVSLNSCDTRDQNCSSRLCWHLDQNVGGYRAGCTLGLNGDSTWRKIIYKASSPLPTALPTKPSAPPTTISPPTAQPNPNACSVLYNYTESSLNTKGYIKCYDQPYSFSTSSAELAACSGSQYVFVGAKSTCDAATFAVGAYGLTSRVFNATASSVTAYQDAAGGAFWYRLPGASFGFASSSSVSLNSCDTSNLDCGSRLCWHLDQNVGGYRAGCTTGLNGEAKWRKVIYKGNAAPSCV